MLITDLPQTLISHSIMSQSLLLCIAIVRVYKAAAHTPAQQVQRRHRAVKRPAATADHSNTFHVMGNTVNCPSFVRALLSASRTAAAFTSVPRSLDLASGW